MIFEQHYLDCLSQASYFIGDESTGKAVVVDPRRDIAPYLQSAAEHSMTIELVLETHFHADFLSGHLELAAATEAPIAYSSVAAPEFATRQLDHGERISLGEVTLEIRHTPGHTPESMSIVVYERADDEVPYGVLTGDTLFIGDVGRPDLLSSVGMTSEDLASSLYDSLHDQLLTLPDATRLYPGHGAGSACGKNLSTDTSSTIGVQRESNYALQPMTRSEFIDVVTAGQTSPPAYFSFSAELNKAERPLFDEDAPPTPLSLDEVLEAQRFGAVILDSRPPEDFAEAHLPGAINVGLAGRYSEFAGSVIPAGSQLVIVADPGREAESITRLARIGYDSVLGFLTDSQHVLATSPLSTATSARIAVADADPLLNADDVQLVDVRQPGETAAGHVEGAILIPLTRLNDELGQLDPAKPTLLYCAGGFRSMIASSVLGRSGFTQVTDLLGGFGAWTDAQRPVVQPVS